MLTGHLVHTLWSSMVWWLVAYVEAKCLKNEWSGVAAMPVSTGLPWGINTLGALDWSDVFGIYPIVIIGNLVHYCKCRSLRAGTQLCISDNQKNSNEKSRYSFFNYSNGRQLLSRAGTQAMDSRYDGHVNLYFILLHTVLVMQKLNLIFT